MMYVVIGKDLYEQHELFITESYTDDSVDTRIESYASYLVPDENEIAVWQPLTVY